jgi:uncharacterized spore protein YtfJ
LKKNYIYYITANINNLNVEANMDVNVNELIKEVTDKIHKNARAKAVFGDPVEKGDRTIIPVSRVSVWGSGGGGFGELAKSEEGQGGGMGLAIKTSAAPVGYIEITSDGAEFIEIHENKRLYMAGMALGAFTVFSFTRLIRKLFKK